MNKLGWVIAGVLAAILTLGAKRENGPSDAVVAKLDELKAQQFFLAHSQMFQHAMTPTCPRVPGFFPTSCRYLDDHYKFKKESLRSMGAEGAPKPADDPGWTQRLHEWVLPDAKHKHNPLTCDFSLHCLDVEVRVVAAEWEEAIEKARKK